MGGLRVSIISAMYPASAIRNYSYMLLGKLVHCKQALCHSFVILCVYCTINGAVATSSCVS